MTYLLDTHSLVWLLTDEGDIPLTVMEDISYYQNNYAVSEVTLYEIIQLQHKGSITLKQSPDELKKKLDSLNISILPVSDRILNQFYDLPTPMIEGKRHSDPFDQIIIATALVCRRRVVSADHCFKWYRDNKRLDLLYYGR
ncbi:MAG: type II toxin-antitoxin system VapC family toxin [Bacteroidales bacterium]|nr:type II toxin-antitoxin system VapC family toxin [Bacteroidales bacterium]